MSITPEELEKTDEEREREEQPGAKADADDLVVEELLVEDVSIDGMCGVY